MEGVAVSVKVHRVEVEDRPDVLDQERQAEGEPGAEHDAVELLGMTVGEGHGRVRDGLHPRSDHDRPSATSGR